MNRRTMTQYRGICKTIATPEFIRNKTTDEFAMFSKNSQIENTILQKDTENNIVLQKIQLQFCYNKNTNCLEIKNAVNENSENPIENNHKIKPENNVEIIIKIKKIEFKN